MCFIIKKRSISSLFAAKISDVFDNSMSVTFLNFAFCFSFEIISLTFNTPDNVFDKVIYEK